MKYQDILSDCIDVAEERWESYWGIEDNFAHWRNILESMFWIKLTEVQLCEVLIAMKYSREKNKHKEDNTIDIINYTAIREYFINFIKTPWNK